MEAVEGAAGFEESPEDNNEAVEDPGGFEEPTSNAVEAVTEARAEDEGVSELCCGLPGPIGPPPVQEA
jgi:hypothetical protein